VKSLQDVKIMVNVVLLYQNYGKMTDVFTYISGRLLLQNLIEKKKTQCEHHPLQTRNTQDKLLTALSCHVQNDTVLRGRTMHAAVKKISR